MGSVGDAYDNAVAESVFATRKAELLPGEVWPTHAVTRSTIFTYVDDWYTDQRRHLARRYASPATYETTHRAARTVTAATLKRVRCARSIPPDLETRPPRPRRALRHYDADPCASASAPVSTYPTPSTALIALAPWVPNPSLVRKWVMWVSIRLAVCSS